MRSQTVLLGVLLLPSAAGAAVSGVQVLATTNVQAVISYQPPSDATCTLQVSEDPGFQPLVPDVDPALFPGADRDNRDGSLADGPNRIFIAGRRAVDQAADRKWYSRALQTDTTHYFQIRCGDDTATGNFRTTNLPVGSTYPWPIPQDSSGNFRWPSVDGDDRNQRIIDPNYGTLIRRITVPGDFAALSWTSQALKRASGANWTNPAAALADDGSSANYSASGNDWLALTDPGLSFSASYEFISGVDFVTVRIKGSAQGSPDQRRIEVCLTIDGANCKGEVRSTTLDPEPGVKTLGNGRADTWGEGLWPKDINANKSFGVLIRAAAAGAQIAIQYVEIDAAMSEVAGASPSGAFYVCAQGKSNGGYHCSFPGGAGSSGNYMFWIQPDTGEVRWLGKLVVPDFNGSSVQCLSQNALWDSSDPNVYYCGAGSNGKALLFKGTYTGNDAPAARSALAQMNWVNLTPNAASIEGLVRDFNAEFDPAVYSCSLYTMVNQYAVFTCLRGNQGSVGWLAVFDPGNKEPIGQTGAGRIIAAAKSFTSPGSRWCGIHSVEPLGNINWIGFTPANSGEFKVTLQSPLPASTGTFTIQVSGEPSPYLMDAAVGDVFQLTGSPGRDLVRILRKNSANEWFVERKVVGASPSEQLSGATLATYCSGFYRDPNTTPSIYWSFLDDPAGRDPSNKTWVVETTLTGSHTVNRGNYRLQSGIDGYQVITPGAPKSWNQPPSFLVESNPKWAGVRGWVGLDAPFAGRESYGSHPSYESYLATGAGRNNWFIDDAPFLGFYRLTTNLLTVRGLSQVFRANGTRLNRDAFPTFGVCGGRMLKEISPGPIRDADSYSFCVGKDCVAGAAPSDVFVNCPPPVSPASFCSQSYFGDPAQVCIADMVPYGQTITQFFFDRSGIRNRVLTNGLMAFHSQRAFMYLDVATALPDGSWVIFPSFANNARRDLYMVKVPAQPSFDGPADALTRPVQVSVSVTPPSEGSVSDAVMQYGPTPKLGLSASPQSCSSGSPCTVTLTAPPGMLVFSKVLFRDNSGRQVGESPLQVRVAGAATAAPPPDTSIVRISNPGVLNAASSQPQIAPGGIVSIYGQNLAGCEARAEGFPLPSALCDAKVTFNGQTARFYYASAAQLNVLMPSAVTPQQDVRVSVERQDGRSAVVTVPGSAVGGVAPAIFAYALEDQLARAVVQNADFSLNGPSRPAANIRPLRPGESATLYANSLGPTAPSVADGQKAPADPLARAARAVDLYINGIRQSVLFAGLTPGLSGMYQVNFVLDPTTPDRSPDQNSVWLVVDGVESPRLRISLGP